MSLFSVHHQMKDETPSLIFVQWCSRFPAPCPNLEQEWTLARLDGMVRCDFRMCPRLKTFGCGPLISHLSLTASQIWIHGSLLRLQLLVIWSLQGTRILVIRADEKFEQLFFIGRCHKNDSWLRGRVLQITEEGVSVFYMDCGRIEVHNEAKRLADMPPDLCSRPEVLKCTLDPTSTWSRLFSSSAC